MHRILYHGKEISETSLQMLKEGKLKERDFTKLAYFSFAGQPQSVEDVLILSGCTNREHVDMIWGPQPQCCSNCGYGLDMEAFICGDASIAFSLGLCSDCHMLWITHNKPNFLNYKCPTF